MSYTETRSQWLAAEKQLAQNLPFGSAEYIRERTALIYRGRLKVLMGLIPEADRLALVPEDTAGEEFDQFFGDPVVRSSIDDLIRAYRDGGERKPNDDQREFLDHYGTNPDELNRETVDAPSSFQQDLVEHPIRYWSDDSVQTLRDRAFAATLRQNLPRPRANLVNAETEATINQALALLHELLPMAGPSAVSHLHFIAVDDFDSFVGSATFAPIHGTIFLFRSTVKSPWTAAEGILHECMHLKFVELEHTHSILAKGYSETTSPRLNPPWHPETELWPMNRVLTAAHVYLTLTLYAMASEAAAPELQARYGPCRRSNLLTDPSLASQRAQSLIDLASQHPESLGKAGQMFLTWMGNILHELTAMHYLEHKAV